MLKTAAKVFTIVAALFLLYLVTQLVIDAWPMMNVAGIFQDGYWDFRFESFSSASMIYGTFVVSSIALLIAFPIGVGAAIYVSEYLVGKRRAVVKIAIEMLAGIPSVVYGLIGIGFLLPLIGPPLMDMGAMSGDSLLAAGLLLAVMILPTMMTFTDDALRCVSRTMREEGYGLGLSKVQVIMSIVFPKARAGIVGAAMLALGRALGETIAIYLVIGRSDQPFSFANLTTESLIASGQTLTTKLGGSELAIAYGSGEHWQALMALGLTLWIVVGVLSLFGETVWGQSS